MFFKNWPGKGKRTNTSETDSTSNTGEHAGLLQKIDSILDQEKINASHHLRSVVDEVEKAGLPAGAGGSNKVLIEKGRLMLGAALGSSLHVYGVPVTVKKFAAFMGNEFIHDPKVRQTVLEAMSKHAHNAHVQTVPSAFNSLAMTFEFTPSEMSPFTMNEKLAEAMRTEKYTVEQIDEAHDRWAAEEEKAGRSPGYDSDFDHRVEMPRQRPR